MKKNHQNQLNEKLGNLQKNEEEIINKYKNELNEKKDELE